MKNWEGKVYRKAKKQRLNFYGSYWRKIRLRVIIRDNYQCQRCGEIKGEFSLNAHHIISRANGGANKMKNLISLCIPCHDFVEINGIDKLIGINKDMIFTTTSDWHKWVYGGYTKKCV